MDDDVMDALHRVFEVKDLRCGEGIWCDPPAGWPEVVRAAWPTVFFLAPVKVPPGWIDVIMAAAEHLLELEPSIHVVDAFEDHCSGGLSLKVTGTNVDHIHQAVSAYEHVASTMCRFCGRKSTIRRTGSGRLARARALCDKHYQEDQNG